MKESPKTRFIENAKRSVEISTPVGYNCVQLLTAEARIRYNRNASYQRGLGGDLSLFRLLSRLRRFGQFETGEYRLGRVAGRPSRVIVPHFDHAVLRRSAALPPEQRVQRVVLAVRDVVAFDVFATFRR